MSKILRNLTFLALFLALLSGCQKESELSDESDPPEELKPLAWMIGDWEDDEGDINVKYTWRWDLENSFMFQTFNLKDSEDNPLSGWQILGFDPVEKRIRSWIYDSDGGFGESDWNLDDGSWYVTTVYTDADGERGSATQVYKVIDDNTFDFSQQSADMGGEFIPNSGPYKFVRKS